MPRVLVLDGSIHADMYRPTDHWRALVGDVQCVSVHLPSGEAVPDPAGFTHVIVTGSEASIVRPEAWFDVEAEAVRRAVEAGAAVLGSCFGHQMLALALSGERHVGASPTPEVGWIEVEIAGRDPLLDGLPDPLHVFASHFDEVREPPPPPWRVLARSAGCPVQAMRWGDRPVWGIQAHPEIGLADARKLLRGFLERHPELDWLLRPALAQEPRDDGAAGEIVRRFLGAR